MKQVFLISSTLLVLQLHAQQSNYHFSHTDSTSASSDKIWWIWTDVPNWKQWDKGLKDAQLEGEFKVGTKGKLTPDKGPRSKFVIREVVPGTSYTFKTKIPFGWLIVKRTLEQKANTTVFTHDVEFTGLLKKVFGKRLGENYRKMLPNVMAEIKKRAESK